MFLEDKAHGEEPEPKWPRWFQHVRFPLVYTHRTGEAYYVVLPQPDKK